MKTIIINPEDFQDEVRVAEVKAMAARYDASVTTSPYIPRKTAYVTNLEDPEDFVYHYEPRPNPFEDDWRWLV